MSGNLLSKQVKNTISEDLSFMIAPSLNRNIKEIQTFTTPQPPLRKRTTSWNLLGAAKKRELIRSQNKKHTI